jgi:hypothetical protein
MKEVPVTKHKNRNLSKEIERKELSKEVRSLRKCWPVLLFLLLSVVGSVAAYLILSLTNTEETDAGTVPGTSSGAAPSTNISDMIYPVIMFEGGTVAEPGLRG